MSFDTIGGILPWASTADEPPPNHQIFEADQIQDGGGGLRFGETQAVEVERRYESVQEADGVFSTDVIVNRFRKEQNLVTI